MGDITGFGLFLGAVLLLNATPGPDTAYIVGRSVAHGRRAGIVSALGITVGCMVHTLACAAGLTALLAASPDAFAVVRIVGALYLVWIGLRLIAGASRREREDRREARAAATTAASDRRLFLQGIVTNLTNPKVVLFFVSFFPQFVRPDGDHKTIAFLSLGCAFVVMSTAWNCGVAWLAGSLTRRLATRPAFSRWADRFVGAVFVALGARFFTIPR